MALYTTGQREMSHMLGTAVMATWGLSKVRGSATFRGKGRTLISLELSHGFVYYEPC